MKISTPVLFTLGTAPALANAWSLGPSYFPSQLVIRSPAVAMLERQQALANRYLKETPNFSSPRYELIDNDEKFQVSVDVPGVKVDDIDVSLEDGYLTVRGQRMASSENSRFTSKFSQTFSLDPAVDVDQFSASLENGVLVVSAPKDLKRIEENIKKIPIMQASLPKADEDEKVEETLAEAKLEDESEVLDLDDNQEPDAADEKTDEVTA